MSTTHSASFSEPGFYRIEVNGCLVRNWYGRLGAMQVSAYLSDDEMEITVLQGAIKDQSELAGIMKTLHELHLTLRSVTYLGKVPANQSQDAISTKDD